MDALEEQMEDMRAALETTEAQSCRVGEVPEVSNAQSH